MVVPVNKNKIIYNGDGSTAVFTWDFPLLVDADLRLQLESSAGVLTTIATANYTLAYTSGDTTGGTVTITDSDDIPSVTEKLVIARIIDSTQDSDYKNTREIPANTLESDLDRRCMVEQQLDEESDRTLKLAITSTGISTDLPAPVADKFLGWDSAATAIENKTPAGEVDSGIPSFGGGDALSIAQINSGGTAVILSTLQEIFTAQTAAIAMGGIMKWRKGADVASTGTMTVGEDGNYFDITGTTGITSIVIKPAGTVILLQFDGVLTVTDGSNLTISGDLVTAAGTTLMLVSGGTNWFELSRNTVMANTTAFLARPASTQENIATGGVTVLFGTEITDVGSNFASSIFTAPTAGNYLLCYNLILLNLIVATDEYAIDIITSNRTYRTNFDPVGLAATTPIWGVTATVVADMDAGDTALISFNQTGGTAVTDISTASWFSGTKV